MQGFAALWLPGMDHAGIATQNVVERELRDEGMTRHDLGRDAFIEQVWAWKARSGNTISTQMRKIGDSVDWSRERFTLDEGLSAAVNKVFVTLYDEGVMYRANRIINWCPRCHTALSEIEVEHEQDPGELTHIKYPFTDGSGYITVATTRPETMLGDTAVAVHPDDERYADAIGKTLLLPILDREIPIVADDGVEHEFGTGAVKVTPAHDPLDFEIGLRHDLEQIKVIDTEAKITRAGGPYFGMDRFEAREAVRSKLRELKLIDKIEEHPHSVGHCSRCHTVIEPMLSLQWFVAVQDLVGPAMEPVRSGETTFHPKRWENSYFHWMENLRDWCVSRQLWWGHRIPAWYCDACDQTIVSEIDPTECSCGSTDLTQDEDVLDTWFSSALWPFSTLGWPEETEDLSRFYPTDVLVTGFDIIFFWVARMMMMGTHFKDQPPFPDILIHGMVRDAEGKKMSKSTGNALDPIELVDEYGADSMRLALIQAAAPGHDIPLSLDAIDAARRFGNKLWNAVRFTVEFMDVDHVPLDGGYPSDPGPEDRWILARLGDVASEVDQLIDEYRLSDAYALLYAFAWSEVFDWYLEMAKSIGADDGSRRDAMQATLGVVMRDVLKLFHPVIPFITEELWSHLGAGSDLIITAPWPEVAAFDAPSHMESLQGVVAGIRQFRSQHQIGRKVDIPVVVASSEGPLPEWWFRQVASLTGATPEAGEGPDSASGRTRISADGVEAFISLEGLVDVEAERPRIEKAIAELETGIARSQGKLANPNFRDRAPAEVVAQEEERLAEMGVELAKQQNHLTELG
jgi:valyl-tRNA synthetase